MVSIPIQRYTTGNERSNLCGAFQDLDLILSLFDELHDRYVVTDSEALFHPNQGQLLRRDLQRSIFENKTSRWVSFSSFFSLGEPFTITRVFSLSNGNQVSSAPRAPPLVKLVTCGSI